MHRTVDESLQMMSGMLAALAPSTSSPKNPDLIEHCERLIIRMQDPYLRAMLTYLTVGDWSEVLQEDALPLRERLAIAFQFLDDQEVSSYLRRVTDRCCHDGDIDGLIVTGLSKACMDILQAYVDTTGDIQTVAILSSLSPSVIHDRRSERWLDIYRDVLDSWKLFHHRCQLDIDRGVILQDAIQHAEMVPFEWAPKQILIRCNYCNKPIEQQLAESKMLRVSLSVQFRVSRTILSATFLGNRLSPLQSSFTSMLYLSDDSEHCQRLRTGCQPCPFGYPR